MSRIFTYKPVVIALSVAFSSNVWASDDVASSWQHSSLRCHAPAQSAQRYAVSPAQSSGGAKLPTDVTRITADKLAGQTNVRAVASGDVIVERNDEVLNAQWVEYDQINETVKAGDEFALTRADGQTVRGKTLNYNLKNNTGKAENSAFEAEHEGRRLQGISGEVEMVDKARSKMRDVKFNTCGAGDHSWYIQASELTANRDTNIGVAKHARLVFGGVPVLYTPWADFPLSGTRKSGLLVPTVKIGSDGTEIETPYYINLAPNRDATITPGVITARGATIGGEFRYLEPKYSGRIWGKYMPHDSRSSYNNRHEAKWEHIHKITDKLTGGVNIHRVSDDDYYRDFYGRNDIAENVHLDNNIWLNYDDKLAGGDFNARLFAQKYQTLADSTGNKDRPYAIMPRISATWQKNTRLAQYNFTSQLTRFDHDQKQSGVRAVAYPSVQWQFNQPWGYVRPKVGLHATRYWLDDWNSTPARNVSRVLPVVNVDTGVTFERETKVFGQDYVQTFEPRLFYNYVKSKSQNDLPNFDSSENAFSYEQLFRENIYSGNDRINSSNSLSIGLQTRFLNRQTGAERFRAGIGQRIYLNTDNVLLSGNIGSTPRDRSDIIMFAGGQVSHNWFADMNWHFNESERRTQRFDAGVRYNPQAGKVLAARFKYGRYEEIYSGFFGKLKHVDLAAQYPITPNLYAVGRLNYSISPFAALEQTLGLEYRNACGCWSVSLVGQRYINGLNSYKNAVYLTLQLKDLSNLGNNPYETLRLGIPGYHKTNEVIKK